MSEAEFAEWGMYIGVGGLILYMFFIIWNLGRESKGGKFAYIALFIALGLGMFAFIAKTVIVEILGM
ncbi:MAG: DUF2788 domain-containing protein [Gammaproteobacteria bacterium]|nr:DUF2788 domain-containing protein [Gammaproteobacteria bacterium]